MRESSLCLQILGNGPNVQKSACVDLVPLRARWERRLQERRGYNGNAADWIGSIKALWTDGEFRSMGTRTRIARKWPVSLHVWIRSFTYNVVLGTHSDNVLAIMERFRRKDSAPFVDGLPYRDLLELLLGCIRR